MEPVPSLLWRQLRVSQIYGANTNVGKTIFATILSKAAARTHQNHRVSYLKPVSTGPDDESDSLCTEFTRQSQLHPATDRSRHLTRYAPEVASKTLFQYEIACSPHSAASASGQPVPSDHTLQTKVHQYAAETAASGPGWLFIETAGGVHSPGPSGTPQADLYAPLRVPVILVGDAKLGGISQTISAFESLKIRGYDVESILLLRGEYGNHDYLREYFQNKTENLAIETAAPPPDPHPTASVDAEQMALYYESESSQESIRALLQNLLNRSQNRIKRLETINHQASKTIWHPFTQQKLLTADRISAIDSAHGDFFQTFNDSQNTTGSSSLLQPAFDGSASWWTQGLGHANPQLTLAAAYAAGRYGHVMFAEAIHEPAMKLAEMLLEGINNPRLTKVFYTDNGSTGCEVAIKMGLRAARNRYGWMPSDKLGILGLKGSYHGDTIGAMDCSEPGPFNEKVEWYQGKGFWLDYPTIRCYNGEWHVDVPESLEPEIGSGSRFADLSDVFALSDDARKNDLQRYKQYIHGAIQRETAKGHKFGALVLEPVILGAGGMLFVDPLFQKALVDVVRENPSLFGQADQAPTADGDWSGLPVIFDEVFTGLYRLGRFTSSSFIDTHADISVHAKLLTGGLVPLCTTLASESIFDAFKSDDKTDALLHGHSYTAHAVGCQVAVESLRELQNLDRSGDWDWAKAGAGQDASPVTTTRSNKGLTWSVWSRDFIDTISRKTDKVSGLWALGSVLAISMRADDGAGYTSRASAKLQAHFRKGTGSWNAHTRVLGNVFYVMTGQKTDKATVEMLQDLCIKGLDE